MSQVKVFPESSTSHIRLLPWMTACGIVLDERAEDSDAPCSCGRCDNSKDWEMVFAYPNGFGILVKKLGRDLTDSLAEPHPVHIDRLASIFRDAGRDEETAYANAVDTVDATFEGHLYQVIIHYPFKLRTLRMILRFSEDQALVNFLDGIIFLLEESEKRYFSLNKIKSLREVLRADNARQRRNKKNRSRRRHR